MDDRTRQRQPLLSTLVGYMEARYQHRRALLQHAAAAGDGDTVILDGRSYQRLWSRADERMRMRASTGRRGSRRG
jgi:hypothetical protein